MKKLWYNKNITFFKIKMKKYFQKALRSAAVFLVAISFVISPVIGSGKSFAVATSSEPLRSEMMSKLLPSNNALQVSRDYAPDELLVRFVNSIDLKKDEGINKAQTFSNAKKLDKKNYFKNSNSALYKIKDGKSVEQKIKDLQSDPNVASVQPNFKYSKTAIPSDTSFPNQWALQNTGQSVNGVIGASGADIKASTAWDISEGAGNTIVVAIIDDGVAYNNADLTPNMWDGTLCVDENGDAVNGGCLHGYEFNSDGSNDNDPLPDIDGDNSHGTHVAGIIAAAKDGAGVIGIAPFAKIMALKSKNLYTSEIVSAIAFASNNGAKIINASWGGYGEDSELRDAIANFSGLFVTAAGNEENDNDGEYGGLYPCSDDLPNIICVGATDQNDELASFSNFGASSVDVGAPGVNILSTVASENVFMDSITSGNPPQNSDWTMTGSMSISGGVIIGDTNKNPYLDNAVNTATQDNVVDLSGLSYGAMSFDATCDTEYISGSFSGNDSWADYMQMDLSNDGGASWVNDFVRFDEAVLDKDADPTGSASATISGLAIDPSFLTNNFKIRLKWVSNSIDNNHAGCSIDNIGIDTMGNGSGNQLAYYDGTSMAAPQVAGLAALTAATYPNLSMAAIKNEILTKGDSLSSLDGVTLTGKRINAQNTLDYLATSADIIDAQFSNSPNVGGGIAENSVDLGVPFGADMKNLVPIFEINGASISPASGVSQDFTNPVIYTVTANDGITTKQYTVSAIEQPSSEKKMTAIKFDGIGYKEVVDEENHTITVTVPFGTNVKNLSAELSFMGESIDPDGHDIDYTNPVIYTVTAADGSTQDYFVTVKVNEDSFSDVKVGFKDDVKSGKTSSTSVRLKFKGAQNAAEYMIAKRNDFSGASWKAYSGNSIKVTLKKKSGKQKFYVKFRDAVGQVSKVYSKTVTYVSPAREIKNSKASLKNGETLVQSGKNFSKNSDVQLFFGKAGGGYYAPQNVKTSSKGSFSVPYVVRKSSGTYSWYALDVKTNKKSSIIKYKVKE
jgi:subtilisin family serine protease